MRLLVILIVTLASLSVAHAQEDVDGLIHDGLELRRSGDDAGALELFQRAVASSGGGRALAQLGFAEQALARWVAADEHLRAALATEDAWVQERRDVIERAQAVIREHLAQLELVGAVDGAEIWIDGALRGSMPLAEPLWVSAGTSQIEVRAEGFHSHRAVIVVRAGVRSLERIRLLPVDGDAPPPPDGEATGVEGLSHAGGVTREPVPHDPLLTVLGAVTLAVGAGAGVGAVIAYAIREERAAEWNDPMRCLLAGGGSREAQCSNARAGAEAAEAAAIGLLVTGGALLALGSVLIALDASADDSPPALACGPGPGDVGIQCGGTW